MASTLLVRALLPCGRSPAAQKTCKECGDDSDQDDLLQCDMCKVQQHFFCLTPPLREKPTTDWYGHLLLPCLFPLMSGLC
jgi:hypothetical protein